MKTENVGTLWGRSDVFELCVYVCAIGNRSVAEGEGLAGFEVDGCYVAFQFGGYGFAVDGHGEGGAVVNEEVDCIGFFGVDVG